MIALKQTHRIAKGRIITLPNLNFIKVELNNYVYRNVFTGAA